MSGGELVKGMETRGRVDLVCWGDLVDDEGLGDVGS